MSNQLSSLPSDPKDKWREMILAIVVFVLLLGVNLLSLGATMLGVGFACVGENDSWFCRTMPWVMLLLPLLCLGGGAFWMFRRRYRHALTLMALPTLVAIIIYVGLVTGSPLFFVFIFFVSLVIIVSLVIGSLLLYPPGVS